MLDARVMELVTALYGYAKWDSLTEEEKQAGKWHTENIIHIIQKHGDMSRDEAIEYLLARQRVRRAKRAAISAP